MTPLPGSPSPSSLAFAGAISGCFALFSLDGYGPSRTTRRSTTPGSPMRSDRGVRGSGVAAVDARAARAHRIFVTDVTFNGNLGARRRRRREVSGRSPTDAGLAGSVPRLAERRAPSDAVDASVARTRDRFACATAPLVAADRRRARRDGTSRADRRRRARTRGRRRRLRRRRPRGVDRHAARRRQRGVSLDCSGWTIGRAALDSGRGRPRRPARGRVDRRAARARATGRRRSTASSS